MATKENKAKMDSLIKKREKYFARLQALYDVGKKCLELAQKKQPYQAELDHFVSRYNRIEDDYSVFEDISDDITIINSDLDDSDKIEVHKVSMSYDEMYFNLKSLARKMQIEQPKTQTSGKSEATPTQPPQSAPQVAELPKIEIEPFNGSIADWPNFYALFNSLIHKNRSLSKSEKLTYLRSLLKSHALSLIENLVISEENYDIALHQLIQRYQNKRLLASR
ncbi:uncharacterized protein LOC129003261 [Macrosteles quadrilineatus]|uniref:uncharacterized protein LOC129003261 n=1 Tax=Macrosteles quadrilineatus TaxID=74068 RepID=UPI0023E23105|nr:uncharacterized protein LOC129003261 [Macrosteles quadrilineatus]